MTDTSPKRLSSLADWLLAHGWTPVAEKENPGQVCPTCGSDCNERDELIKAEREIERLRAEIRQRERMNARFANRAPSPPTADFDLPHESDDAAGHAEQHPEMAKSADVPLPEPVAFVGDVYSLHWYGSGPIDVIVNKHGIKPGAILVTQKQAEACAKAARDAAFDECAEIMQRQHTWITSIAAYQLIQAAKRGTT